MTISSEVRIAGPYPGNGTATTFPFSFKIFQAADLLVVLTVDGAEQRLSIGADYTVNLNSAQEVSPGGEVVLNTVLLADQLLTLTSDLQNLQPTQITNQGAFYPDVINQALDRVTILVQQVVEKVSRAVKVPISSSTSPDDLISSLNQSAADAIAAAADAQQTSAEISIKVEAAQSAQAGAEAAQAGAEAVLENAVQQTSDTGAALLPEGTDAQRPATGSIPAGALVMRGNTQTVGDYIAEYWDRGASAWRSFASRTWVGQQITAAIDAVKVWVNEQIGFAIVYPNGGTAAAPANAAINSRYPVANPFPGHHVMCVAEILVGGKWGAAGWLYVASGGQGMLASEFDGSIVVQTGAIGISHGGSTIGQPNPAITGSISVAPQRVKVWRVRGATS